MISKEDLLASLRFECDICIHLHGKIPDGGLDYRPTPGQRSTRELLRYLSFHAAAFAIAIVDSEWETYSKMAAEAEALEPGDFPAAMEEQKRRLGEIFERITEEDIATKEVPLPWGVSLPMGRALLDLAYRSLTSYRMQLFLYAKAAGNRDLTTPNCFAGVDMDF